MDGIAALTGGAETHSRVGALAMPLTLAVQATQPRFVTKPSRVPAWRLLHRVADRAYPELRTLWATVFAEVRAGIDEAALQQALTDGNLFEAEHLLTQAWNAQVDGPARRLLPQILQQTVEAARETLAPGIVKALDLPTVEFGVPSPDILQAIEQYAAQHITGIGETSKQAIRAILRRGVTDGLSPAQQQRLIEAVIGLTEPQARALAHLEARLRADGLSPAQVQRALERARRQALRLRAETIARTESIDAASRGQQSLWEEAAQRGLLPPTFRRFWVVTPDDRLCTTICAPIPGMNPQGVGLHEPFQTPIGPRMTPTAHPMCRCVIDGRIVRT